MTTLRRSFPLLVVLAAAALPSSEVAAQCSAIRLGPQALPAATVGSPYGQTVTQTGGGAGTAFSISAGALPAGLSLNPATGLIDGTPTAAGTALFTVRATDPADGCSGGRTYAVAVACSTITVAPPATTGGTAGLPFGETFTQSGGALPVSFTLDTGALPNGLTLDASGLLSGTPTESGVFPITVLATDANGCTGTSPTYTLTIVPAATSETYSQTVVGNMAIDTSTGTTYSVLADDVGTGLTASLVSGTTSAGGTVTLNGATGTFTYDPPRGFEGPDTFQYTVSGAGGTSGPATVTVNVSGVVWFVAATAAPGGDGRRSAPYDSLAAFVAVNDGLGSNPGPNDRVFLFENAAAYAGPLPLLDAQRLVGQDATGTFAAAVGYTVPDTTLDVPLLDSANGVKATIANAGNAVVLATGTGNALRGLTLSVSAGAGISGTGTLGSVSVSEVAVVTSGSASGISLTSQSGLLTFGGSITGDGTAAGVLLSGGDGLVQVNGSTVAKTGGRLVDVQGKTGGGLSFSTGSLSVTGAATDAVVLVNNTSTQVDFAAGLSVTTTAGRGLVVDNSTTTTFGGGGSTVNATGGAALDVSGTDFLGDASFSSASSTNSPAEGIRIVNVTGKVTIGGGSISGSTGTAFLVSGGSSDVGYAGTISKSNAGRAVDVQGRSGGTVTLSGAVAAEGPSTGISVTGPTAASTVAFTGTVELGNNVVRLAGGTALTLDHNAQAGAVTSFASLTVRTLGQAGIDASNGGTLNAASGEVDVQAGRALRANGITLGVTMNGIASIGSPAEGVSLTNVAGSLSASVTSVTNPGTQGILVTGSSLNATFGSPVSVSGSGNQRILVTTSTGNLSFGLVNLGGGTDAISLQNNSSGTRTFGTIVTNGNSGVGFLHANGGGAVTVLGNATFTNPGGTGIDIQGNTSALSFAQVLVDKGASSGTGVNLANNTTAPSFGLLDVSASNGTGIAISASGIATSGGTVSATNGPAISASAGAFSGSLTLAFSTNSPSQGISLTNCTGTYTIGGGTITGAAGTAFAVSGGSVSFTYAGTVTQNSAQRVVDVQSTTGGTISVGTATGGFASTGVNVNAANGNVTFTNLTLGASGGRMASPAVTIDGGTGTYSLGTVSIFTTGGTAKGIGAVNADGTINATAGTVDAAGAPAIDVDGPAGLTTLGMTLTSVSANGGANGLLLRDTNGTFTVTGTGSAGSGGTIQGCTARGARFQNAAGVSLSWMTFSNDGTNQDAAVTCGDALNGTNTNCGAGIDFQTVAGASLSNVTVSGGGQIGINGNSVTNLAMSSVTVQNAGNENLEDGVQLVNLLGTCTVAGSTFTGNYHRQLEVQNSSGTLTSLAITGSTFDRGAYVSTAAQGLLIAGRGTAAMTASVKGSSFQRNFGSGFFGQSIDTANLSLTVGDAGSPALGNTFTDNSLVSQVLADNGSTQNATVARNTATVSPVVTSGATPVTFRKSFPATGFLSGSFSGNTIGSGAPQSGNNCAGCNGLSVTNEGSSGGMNLSVTNNTIQHVNQRGMEVLLQNADPLSVVVTGNAIQSPDGTIGQAIFGQSGNDATDTGTLCMDVTGNTIGGLWDTGVIPAGRNIRLRQAPAGGSTPFRLRNVGGTTAADANNYLNANNTNALAGCSAGTGFTTGAPPCF